MPPARARRKLTSLSTLTRIARRARREGRRVVFTNGCFDLLHAGHVRLLERAKRCGDLLVVAINSDRSVRALKGRRRPLVAQRDRAELVAALGCVDYVTIFHEPTPLRLIRHLRPHVLIKGADWDVGRIVGRELVEQDGGRIVRIPLRHGYSTTALIRRIQKA